MSYIELGGGGLGSRLIYSVYVDPYVLQCTCTGERVPMSLHFIYIMCTELLCYTFTTMKHEWSST